VCQRKPHNTHKECVDYNWIRDSGKSIKLEPRFPKEVVTTILIDNCVIKGSKRIKCDALFLYKTIRDQIYSFLVELKGTDVKHAFEQIVATKNSDEYKNILSKLEKKAIEKFVIVSNVQINKIELQKLESEFKIRIGDILYNEPHTPIPDLKSRI
jgi:hypothetical protein